MRQQATGVSAGALLLSASQVTTPLDSIGMPGCQLFLGPLAATFPVPISNVVQMPSALPDRPAFFGDL